jgi:Transcriptional regulatory protein, C terminal
MASLGSPPGLIRFGPFALDPTNRELRKRGSLVKLQPQQFAVLLLLIERAGQIVSREEIHKHIWGNDTFVDSNAASTSPSTRSAPHSETMQTSRVISRPFPAPAIASSRPLRMMSREQRTLPFQKFPCRAIARRMAPKIRSIHRHLPTRPSQPPHPGLPSLRAF